MVTSFLPPPNYHHHPTQSPRDMDSNNVRRVFGSFKNKLHISAEPKGSSQTVASTGPRDPQTGAAPATRRPNRPGMNAFTVPSNEPPPAYTPNPDPACPSPSPTSVLSQRLLRSISSTSRSATSSSSSVATATPTAANDGDDKFSFLSTFDTIFLIDDSGSMAGRSWRECSLALEMIAPICTKYDADGIDIHFLNTPERDMHRNVQTAARVHEIFSFVRPTGGTPTGQRLNAILKPYLAAYQQDPASVKPLNIIVITDGVPADDVESVIISAARKLDALDAAPWQVGIQMFQVGEEEGAAEHLESLDDELARMGGGCRDIVDTVPFVRGPNGRGMGLSGQGILKVVLGAVNKRLDRRRNSSPGLVG